MIYKKRHKKRKEISLRKIRLSRIMKYTSREYSNEILSVIDNKRIVISNKEKNIKFLNEYSIRDSERKNIIRSLTSRNFVEKRKNGDLRIKSDWLYIFDPICQLTNSSGIDEFVKLYIKICIIDDVVYVESFHEDSDY